MRDNPIRGFIYERDVIDRSLADADANSMCVVIFEILPKLGP